MLPDNDGQDTYHTIDQNIHPFRPIDIQLPDDGTGVVYIIISCQYPDISYIGQTINLSRRIDQHNSRCGSYQTSSVELQPWLLLAYVAGFGNSVSKRKAFESQWKQARERESAHLTIEGIADLATMVISMRKNDDRQEDLRYIRTGTYVIV